MKPITGTVAVMTLESDYLTFPALDPAGRIPCPECGGTGWWGYGPEDIVNGPCVVCKGQGRVWVGLF